MSKQKFSLSLKIWCEQNNKEYILKELPDGIDPDTMGYGSGKILNWKCHKCGHEWSAQVNRRTQGHDCPLCKGKIVVKGQNDLKTLRPELVKDWNDDDIDPSDVSLFSSKIVKWKCHKCGYEWSYRISTRVIHDKCPCCEANRNLKKGVNDLFTKLPHLKEEWDYDKNAGIDPSELMPHSTVRVYWKCKTCGHVWESTVINRKRGRNCPKCSRKK